MDRTYTRSWIFFTLVIGILFIGFYKSYFGLLQKFDSIPTAQHLHTGLFLLWFVLLFVQPYLIRTGRVKLHRILANFSYVLIPLLVISVFSLTKTQFQRELGLYPRSQCIANLIIPLPQIALFVTLYILGMINAKKTDFHIRYMVGTAIVLIGPGLGRMLISWFGISFPQAVQISFFITELILVGLIIYDVKKGKRYKPYLVLLILYLSSHVAWYILPESFLWQHFAGLFAQLCF